MDDSGTRAIESIGNKATDAIDVAIDFLEEVQKIIRSGRPKTLRLRFGDKVVKEVPLALGVGAAFAAGLVAVLLTKLAIEIEHEES